MCKPPKDQDENEKIHEKLSEEYYKPETLMGGLKSYKKTISKHWDFKEKNKILVGSTSVMANLYSTSKRYRTSTLSSHNSQSTPSI